MRPVTAPPNLNELNEEFLWCVNRRERSVFRRHSLASRARSCWWPGQTEDGKKHWKMEGEDEVFPWEGASDTRVHMVDTYCREDVALLMTVWRRAKILASPVETNDAAWANRLTNVLRWMKYTQMEEAPREVRLLANWQLERGTAVAGVFWNRKMQLGYDVIDLEKIQTIAMAAQAAMQQGGNDIHPEIANQDLITLPAIIMDPTQEEKAFGIAEKLYPDASKSSMRKALKDLRSTGVARLARAYLCENRPCITAFSTNEDIFIPPEAGGIQEASGIYWRELLTDTALRERVHSHGWDKAWVDEVIDKRRGQMTSAVDGLSTGRMNLGQSKLQMTVDTSKLYEIIHAYRRVSDEDGVPGIFYTAFNNGLLSKTGKGKKGVTWGYHGLLNYDHGKYPFVLFENETRSRVIDDSRGYGEVMSTWQDGVKAEVDMQRDRASLATIPPSFHPPGAAPDRWGPGVQIPTAQPAAYGFFKAPNYDSGSQASESKLRMIADRWAGRTLPDQSNATQATLMTQNAADQWMEGHKKIDTMILQLMQQFMDDQFYFRIVGSEKGRSIHTSREDIQGGFDISMQYTTDDLVPAVVKEKLALMSQAIAMDRTGRVDTAEATAVGFEMIDPTLGERLIMPAQAAAEAELKDEADVFAQMMAGISVDVKPGQNYQARLKWLQDMLAQNQEAKSKYDKSEYFRSLLEKRIQQLKFQIEQYTVNAQIGRTGA